MLFNTLALMTDTVAPEALARLQPLFREAADTAGLGDDAVVRCLWSPAAPDYVVLHVDEAVRERLERIDLAVVAAPRLGARAWEVRLLRGSVELDQVHAVEPSGATRWQSVFDDTFPAEVSRELEHPDTSPARYDWLLERERRRRGLGRLERDTGVRLEEVLDVELGGAQPGVHVLELPARGDWRAALEAWRASRPAALKKRPAARLTPPAPPAAAPTSPRASNPSRAAPTAFEVLIGWAEADPRLFGGALVGLNELARGGAIEPGTLRFTLHRVGASLWLRCLPPPQVVVRDAAAWFERHVPWFRDVAPLALVIRHRPDLPAVGIRADFALLGREGRAAFASVGASPDALYEADEAAGTLAFRPAPMREGAPSDAFLRELLGARELSTWRAFWKDALGDAFQSAPSAVRPAPPAAEPGPKTRAPSKKKRTPAARSPSAKPSARGRGRAR